MHTKSTASQTITSNTAILLIGSGRLATHLQHWNSLLDTPNQLLCWNRSENLETLESYLKQSSIVWLAISDSAIQPFFEAHLKSHHKVVVHFSGALNDERILCAHPLMSFPQNLLPDEIYKKIHFVTTGFENLNATLPGFQNSFTCMAPENKSFYHALCVLAGNFPQLLWNEVASQMNQLQLPPEALELYIKQITENYLIAKEKALTGPIIRKDYVTIEKNISSLEKSPKLKNIYTTFTKEFSL